MTRLTEREREVLALMAQGRSNSGIAASLVLSERAVAKHINNIFTKLEMRPTSDVNRRVLAVLNFLHGRTEASAATSAAGTGPTTSDSGPPPRGWPHRGDLAHRRRVGGPNSSTRRRPAGERPEEPAQP